MGSMCSVSVQNLPTSTKAVTGTQIPQWVSEAGKRLFQQSAELAKSPFPQYTGARVASYNGSKLSPEEQRAMGILGRDSYSQFMNQASQAAGQLGQGYQRIPTSQLLGYDPAGGGMQFQPSPPMQPVIGTPLEQGAMVPPMQPPMVDPMEDPMIPPMQPPMVDPMEDPMIDPMQPVIGTPMESAADTSTDYVSPGYRGATRQELLGTEQDLNRYSDVFQQAVDPAVEEIQRQFDLQRNIDAAQAAKSGAFGGSRAEIQRQLGISEQARRAGDLRKTAAVEGLQFGASQAERDRAARFQAEQLKRGQYETDVQARLAAEEAARAGFETEESARLAQQKVLTQMAPLIQSLQQQQAAGLISAGEARRALDQRALDLAYADFVQQQQYPQEQLKFALGALKGVPYDTKQFSLSQGQQYVQSPSVYGQTIGGLGSLYGAYKMLT